MTRSWGGTLHGGATPAQGDGDGRRQAGDRDARDDTADDAQATVSQSIVCASSTLSTGPSSLSARTSTEDLDGTRGATIWARIIACASIGAPLMRMRMSVLWRASISVMLAPVSATGTAGSPSTMVLFSLITSRLFVLASVRLPFIEFRVSHYKHPGKRGLAGDEELITRLISTYLDYDP